MIYERLSIEEIRDHYSNFIADENTINFFSQKYVDDDITLEELDLLKILILNVTKNIIKKTKISEDSIVFAPCGSFFTTNLSSFEKSWELCGAQFACAREMLGGPFDDVWARYNPSRKLIKNDEVCWLLWKNIKENLDEKIFNFLLSKCCFDNETLKNYLNVSCDFLFEFFSSYDYNVHCSVYRPSYDEYYMSKSYEGKIVVSNNKKLLTFPIKWCEISN